MTVTELREWLANQPQEAVVLLHDPDTGWFMPIKTGTNNDMHFAHEAPAGYVILTAEYGTEIR